MAWLGTYAYRRKITVDNTNIDSDLTHFPVPIVLGTSVGQSSQDVSDIFDEVGASYLKIAITKVDGTTQIYGDIELWDNITEKAVVHVAKSDLDITSASVTELYLYYDLAQADNTTYIGLSGSIAAQSVYASKMQCVLNMLNGTTTSVIDSTANNNDGTKLENDPQESSSGLLGLCQSYDSNDDYVSLPSSVISGKDFTITIAEHATDSTEGYFLSDSNDYSNLFFRRSDSSTTVDGGIGDQAWQGGGSAITLSANTWHIHTITHNSSGTWEWFIADASQGTQGSSNFTSLGSALYLGNRQDLGRDFTGFLDTVRISNVVESDAWIKAINYALIDDFIIFGSIENVPIQVETPVILPVSGAYQANQSISISCATSGADIYYTEDGSTPDSGDTLYTTPFVLGSAKTIKAIGIKAGLTDSDIATEVYTIAELANQPIINILT